MGSGSYSTVVTNTSRLTQLSSQTIPFPATNISSGSPITTNIRWKNLVGVFIHVTNITSSGYFMLALALSSTSVSIFNVSLVPSASGVSVYLPVRAPANATATDMVMIGANSGSATVAITGFYAEAS